MSDCLFCKIVAGEIPADIVAETEHTVAFRDINDLPQVLEGRPVDVALAAAQWHRSARPSWPARSW